MRSFALFALALTACQEQGFHSLNDQEGVQPLLRVAPELLSFGQLEVGETAVQTFTAYSEGDGPLTLGAFTLSGETAANFTLLDEGQGVVIRPGESMPFDVAFSPLVEGTIEAEIWVSSDGGDAEVDLVGEGWVERDVDPKPDPDPDPDPDPEPDPDPAPDLVITPSAYDFGAVDIECDATTDLRLLNAGDADLTITELIEDSASLNYSYFFSLPLTLAPGESEAVAVRFAAADESAVAGTLTAVSDDPDGDEVAEQTGHGGYPDWHSDEFEVVDPPADLMFLVDQSCSMDTYQARLNTNFTYFIANLADYAVDWQVIVANSDDGCNNSGILTQASVGYQASFQQAVSSCAGTCRWFGDSSEALLTPAAAGVENTDGIECNAGFIRTDAMLHIVLVSDEDDQSTASWTHYVDRIIAQKGDAAQVIISAFTGSSDDGYAEAVSATGGLEAPISASNWAPYMEDLAAISVPDTRFELSAEPIIASIEVYLNGSLLADSLWTYNAINNAIELDYELLGLVDGDEVLVEYGEASDCL